MNELSYGMDSTIQSQGDMLSRLIKWAKSLKISPQLKALVRSLIDYWNISKRNPFPSIKRLAEELCVSRQTIHKYLNKLEAAGIIARKKRFRADGGRTSNTYRLLHGLHGACKQVVTTIKKSNRNVKHADKPNVVYISEPEKQLPKETDNKSTASSNSAHKCTLNPKARAAKDSVIASNYAEPRSKDNLVVRVSETSFSSRGNELREQTSFSTPNHKDKKKVTRHYRIETKKMTSLVECKRHHAIAIERKWIDDSDRTRLAYFSSWAKVMRKYREGKAKNPAALLVHILKQNLVHKYPDNVDEQKALKIIRVMKAEQFNSHMGE